MSVPRWIGRPSAPIALLLLVFSAAASAQDKPPIGPPASGGGGGPAPACAGCPANAITITAVTQPMIVSPNASGVTAVYNVANGYSYDVDVNLSCGTPTAPVTSCSNITPSYVNLAAGAETTVSATFSVSGTMGTGYLQILGYHDALTGPNPAHGLQQVIVSGPIAPTVALTANPQGNHDRSLCFTAAAGPGAVQCGDLLLAHAMPAFATLGRQRTLSLVYSSATAAPRPSVAALVTQPENAPAPQSVYAELRVGTLTGAQSVVASGTWSGWGGGPFGDTRQIVLDFDATTVGLGTGIFAYTLVVRNQYPGQTFETSVSSQLVTIDQSNSPFGRGWAAAGVERILWFDDGAGFPGGYMLWWSGDGSAKVYGYIGSNRWLAPAGEFRDTLHLYAPSCPSSYCRRTADGTLITYNGSGTHASTTTRTGQVTTFTYDGSHRLVSIAVPPAGTGGTYIVSYTGSVVDRITDPAGRALVATMTAGKLTQLRDPDNASTSYGYDAVGRLTTRTDRRGFGTTFVYQTSLRLTEVRIPQGATGSTTANTTFEPWDEKGLARIATNTAHGPVDSVFTRLLGPRIGVADDATFWLDRFGQVRRVRDALGFITTIEQTNATFPALPTRLVRPLGQILGAVYDSRGNLIQFTDSSTSIAGQFAKTRYEWDPAWNEVTKIVPPAGDSVVMAYDATTGNRIWQQDARGASSRVEFRYYAATGLLRAIDPPLAPPDSVVYDSRGNVYQTVSPRGFVATSHKDAIGRDTLVVTPIDTLQTVLRRDRSSYNQMNQVLTAVSFSPGFGPAAAETLTVATSYDAAGNLIGLSRTAAPDLASIGTSTTQWRYDAAGQRVAEVAPDGRVDSTAYDAAGNVTATVTRRNYTIVMQYNALNRLTQRIIPNVAKLDTTASDWHFPYYALPTFADTATFTYDGTGSLLTANNRDARIKRTYNLNGSLRTDSLWTRTYAELSAGGNFTSHAYGLKHGYDLNGRRIFTLVPRQLGARFPAAPTVVYDSMAFSYTSFGATGSTRDILGNVFSYTYDLDGRVDKLLYPLGDYKQYTYNADGAPTLIHEDRTASGNPSQNNNIEARYDARGKIVELNPLSSGYGWVPNAYNGLGALKSNRQKTSVILQITPRDNFDMYAVDALGNVTRLQSTYAYTHHGNGHPCNGATMSAFGESSSTRYYAVGTGRLLSVYDTASSGSTSNIGGCYGSGWRGKRSEGRLYDHAGNEYWITMDARDTSQCGDPSCFPVEALSSGRTAKYYDAADRLRVLDAQATGTIGWLSATPPSFEEYRYDALGRRVLRRARRLSPPVGWSAGSVDQIQRFVWDGAHLAADVQYPGSDAMTATQLERDTVTLATDSRYFGRAIYLPGEAIDRPVSVVRMGYGTDVGGTFKTWDPFAMSPRWDIQGRGYHQAYYVSTTSCRAAGGDVPCPSPLWPARKAYGSLIQGTTYPHLSYGGWWGSLVQDQQDASGQTYRRNRYYDAATGRFTQEDPIGLAGGLNVYGFANGDPINFSDPFGLGPCPPCEAVASAGEAISLTPHPVARAVGRGIVLAASTIAVAKAASDKLDQWKSVTYTRTNLSTGQVYSGRTSGFAEPAVLIARREARHPERLSGFGPAQPDRVGYGIAGAFAIRGREQQLVDFHGGAQSGGGTSANLIRAVGKVNLAGPQLHWASNLMFGPLAPYTGY